VKPWTPGTVAARPLHAPPPLEARGFTRRREQGRKTGGSGLASFPFPFSAGGDNHRHLQ